MTSVLNLYEKEYIYIHYHMPIRHTLTKLFKFKFKKTGLNYEVLRKFLWVNN